MASRWVFGLIFGLVIISFAGYLFIKSDSGYRNDVARAKILIGEIGKSLDQFYTDCGFYPETKQGLAALMQNPTHGRKCSHWGHDPYLKWIPKDPWGHEIAYRNVDEKHFTLRSFGKDGKEGGEGLDRDISGDEEGNFQ